MKKLFLILCFTSLLFGMDMKTKNALIECSKKSDAVSRLICFDKLVLKAKQKNDLEIKAQVLLKDCNQCHGDNWDISTNGDTLLEDMTKYEIKTSLLAYKTKKIKSPVMNFKMAKYTDEEIEIMASFIRYEVESKKE